MAEFVPAGKFVTIRIDQHDADGEIYRTSYRFCRKQELERLLDRIALAYNMETTLVTIQER